MTGEHQTDEHRKTRVFISYSRRDSAFVNTLYSALRERSYDAFLDLQDIGVGEEWRPRLEKLILDADVVVFVVTDASLESEHCKWEVERTGELGKRVVPLAHGRPGKQAPNWLGAINWVYSDHPQTGETTPERPTQSAVEKLCEAINVDIRWVRKRSDFTARSEEWRRSDEREDRLLPESVVEDAERMLADAPTPEAVSAPLRRFVALSQRHVRAEKARRVARAASAELQRQRGDGALAQIREFVASYSEDAFEWAPELSAEGSKALTSVGLPFEPFKAAADEKRKLGILDSMGLVLTTAGAELSLWNATDLSLSEIVRFDRPIAGIETDDLANNVLITFKDGSVFVWNARTKQAGVNIISEPVHTQIARFTSAGRTVLTFDVTNNGRVWETATGRQLEPKEAGFTSFAGAHFDQEARRIVSMSHFGVLRQWQLGNAKELPRDGNDPSVEIRQWYPGTEIARAEFDPTGRYIFVEGHPPHRSAPVPRSLYALERGPQRHTLRWLLDLPFETCTGRSIAFSSDGEHLAMQLADRRVVVLQARDGKHSTTAPSGTEYGELALVKGGETLLGLTQAGTIDVWRRDIGDNAAGPFKPAALGKASPGANRRGILRQAVWLPHGGVTSVEFRSDGAAVAAAFRNGAIGVYSSDGTGDFFDSRLDAVARGVSLTSSGDAALVTFGSGYAGVVSLRDRTWRFLSKFGDGIQWRGAWLDGSSSVAIVSGDGVVRVLDARGEVTASFDAHAGNLLALAVLSPQELFVGASSGQIVALARTPVGLVERYRRKVSDDPVVALRPFPQGDRLAAACADGPLVLLDIQSTQLTKIQVSGDPPTDIDVSPDGTRISAATRGGEIGVLDASNGRMLLWSKVHDRPVWSIRFSPRGDALALGLEDGSIRIIDVAHTSELAADYRRAFLTLAEYHEPGEKGQPNPVKALPNFFGGWDAQLDAVQEQDTSAPPRSEGWAPRQHNPGSRFLAVAGAVLLVAALVVVSAAVVFWIPIQW